jgi:RHS repeat-associated protein
MLFCLLLCVLGFAASSVVEPLPAEATTVSGHITTDTHWTLTNSPYVVNTSVTVDAGKTLTIDHGVTVKFPTNGTITVNGNLVADGTASDAVHLTSIKDDSDGVDSGLDGTTTPHPGDWAKIAFSGSGSTGTFTHAIVQYGGAGSSNLNGMISLGSSAGSVSITDSTVQYAAATGIVTNGASGTLTLTRTKVAENGWGTGGTSNTGNGMLVNLARIVVADSAIWHNAKDGVRIQLNSTTTGSPSEINGTSIWMNGQGSTTASQGGVSFSLPGVASGLAPDGNDNNIYDNGTFSALGDWAQVVQNAYRADADWTDNYWGTLFIEGCSHVMATDGNANWHMSYGVPDLPTGAGTAYTRGPAGYEQDAWASQDGGPCGDDTASGHKTGFSSHDNITTFPYSATQLALTFPTPPPMHGGAALTQTLGCLPCNSDTESVIHAMAPPPNAPDAAMSGVRYIGEPVNASTGTLTESFTDVSLPGPGIPFAWTRTYNSRDTSSGIFGTGWTSTFDTHLTIAGNGDVTYYAGDGQQTLFVKTGSQYVARGMDATLTKLVGGSYKLVSPDQRTFAFDSTGHPTSMASRFGPAMTMTYTSGKLTGITDSAGRSITIAYSGSVVSSVTLPDSRQVGYTYASGRLATVTDMRGKTWTIGYDSNGYLNSIQDPLSHYPLRVTYDSSGRVLSEEDGENQTTTYSYSTVNGYQVTTVTPPGRGSFVYKSQGNLPFYETDPQGRTTAYGYDGNFRLALRTDPRGKTTTYEYDYSGNLVKQRAPAPLSYTRTWQYNATNDLLKATDWRGHDTTYVYATSATSDYQVGQLQTMTDAESGVTTYKYYTSSVKKGLVKSVQNPRLKTTAMDYDSAGNLSSLATSLSNQTTMAYDSSGRLMNLVDARGNAGVPADHRTSWTYNDGDQVLSVTNARGKSVSYTYDDAARRHTMVTPDGTTTFYYDNANRLTKTTSPRSGDELRTYTNDGLLASVTSPEGAEQTFGYDNAGQLTSLVEPRGNTAGATVNDFKWTYTYDDAGNRSTAAHPDGGTTTYTHDALNRLTSVEDPLHHTTSYDYDANGNLTTTTSPLTFTRSIAYDNLNRPTTITDERGKQTDYAYFPTGELKSVTTDRGKKTSYTLDDDGRRATMVEARGNEPSANPADFTWLYGYDPTGNLTSVEDPLGHETDYGYDAVANRTSVRDPKLKTTSYTYDDMNRLLTATTPGSPAATTTYTYDADGNLKTRTDPKTNLTTWNYDLDDQVTDKTSPIGQWTYLYDDAGNVTTETTPAGTSTPTAGDGQIGYTYDKMNRLVGVNYSDSTPDLTYAFNAAGLRTSMTDGTGTESYDYDDNNRLTDVTRGSDAFHYDYDHLNLTDRTYPDGTTITATYDDDEELATLTSNSKTTNFTWDAAGNLATTTNPTGNGYVETRTYDDAGRLTDIANTSGATTLSEFNQTLDDNGNPTLLATTRGATTTNTAYTYDDRNRLTNACYGVTTCTGASNYLSYAYDKNSNITAINRVGSVPNPGSWALSYNTADQLTSKTDGTTTINYGYDTNGNQTSAGSASYAYDLADHETSSTVGSTTTNYTYDGDGKRLSTAVSGGSTLRYWWDVANPMPMLAQENDGSGNLVRRFINGPQGALSMATGGSTYYLHRDPIGSITDVTDASGNPEWKTEYEPYGDIKAQTKIDPSAPTVTLGFAGQYLDASTNSYQMRARQYDPVNGQFTSLDPATPLLTTPYAGSYTYVEGTPTVATDPLGLCDLGCIFGAAGEVGGSLLSDGAAFVVDHRDGIALVGTTALAFTPLGPYAYGAYALYTAANVGWDMYQGYQCNGWSGAFSALQDDWMEVASVALPYGVGKLGTFLRGGETASPLFSQYEARVFRSVGGDAEARISLEEAAEAASRNGIDMRMMELQYEPGPWEGFISQTGLGVPFRGATGKIIVTLRDGGLASEREAVITIAHELNHVRGLLRSGQTTPEPVAERAGQLAGRFFR